MLFAEQIYAYCRLLQQRADVDIVLLGGSAEEDKATEIVQMRESGDRIEVALTGHSILEFVGLLAEVDLLLCGDTLALHIAPALGLPTVAIFGPTSFAEIHTFDGLIAKTREESLDCLVCQGDCNKELNCMSLLKMDHLVNLTIYHLHHATGRAESRTGKRD